MSRGVIPSVPRGNYGWRTQAYLPQYFGYAYYVPNYSYQLNYSVPFATYPGDYYVPHSYYPRPYNAHNRYEQTQNVVCYPNGDSSRFCPVNTQHVMDDDGKSQCLSPATGVQITAPTSLAQCQDPTSWPADIAYKQLES